MVDDNEVWKPALGFEGAYEVSSLGRVRSLDRVTDRGRKWKGRISAPKPRYDGYVPVTMWREGAQHVLLIHAVVLASFVGPRPEGLEVLHRDGDRANNRLDNLSWGTHAENVRDQLAHGTHTHAALEACPQGHPYSGENLYVYPGRPHRGCRECRRTHSRNQARRIAAARRGEAA